MSLKTQQTQRFSRKDHGGIGIETPNEYFRLTQNSQNLRNKNKVMTNQFGRVNRKFSNYKIDNRAFEPLISVKEKSVEKRDNLPTVNRNIPRMVINRSKETKSRKKLMYPLKLQPFAQQKIAAKARREASLLRKKVFKLEREKGAKSAEVSIIREKYDFLKRKLEENNNKSKEKRDSLMDNNIKMNYQKTINDLKTRLKSTTTKFEEQTEKEKMLIKKLNEFKNLENLEKTKTKISDRNFINGRNDKKDKPFKQNFEISENKEKEAISNFLNFERMKKDRKESLQKIEIEEKSAVSKIYEKFGESIENCLPQCPGSVIPKSIELSKSNEIGKMVDELCSLYVGPKCPCLQQKLLKVFDKMVSVSTKVLEPISKNLPFITAILSSLQETDIESENVPSAQHLLSLLSALTKHKTWKEKNPFLIKCANFIYDGHFNRIINNAKKVELKRFSFTIASVLVRDKEALSFVSKCFIDEGDSPLIKVFSDFEKFRKITLIKVLSFSNSIFENSSDEPPNKGCLESISSELRYLQGAFSFLLSMCSEHPKEGTDIILDLSSFVCPGGVLKSLVKSLNLHISCVEFHFVPKPGEENNYGVILKEFLRAELFLFSHLLSKGKFGESELAEMEYFVKDIGNQIKEFEGEDLIASILENSIKSVYK